MISLTDSGSHLAAMPMFSSLDLVSFISWRSLLSWLVGKNFLGWKLNGEILDWTDTELFGVDGGWINFDESGDANMKNSNKKLSKKQEKFQF